ncbi:Hypothetical protein CAP_0422 [Chondromyces apiculatus DSM 436]|uniref:Uncharacterized protein n=1 Tax=Chondromyces apiculatus DSM 436 TaxID=1192034 RepID=A0A017SV37_9BACT|nr:Hypothetical protein CAP_0422 [Chondromyces apiculatus DSM 436]
MQDDSEKISHVLTEAIARFPSSPNVESWSWFPYIDSTGDNAAQITIVLTDKQGAGTPVYDWSELAPLEGIIQQSFRDESINRWPYVRFVLKSELEEPVDDGSEGVEEQDQDEDEFPPRAANG